MIEDVMAIGPRTIRPHVSLSHVAETMREGGYDSLVVTTSDGILVGVLRRDDVDAQVAA